MHCALRIVYEIKSLKLIVGNGSYMQFYDYATNHDIWCNSQNTNFLTELGCNYTNLKNIEAPP
jgi:hypothetical protein